MKCLSSDRKGAECKYFDTLSNTEVLPNNIDLALLHLTLLSVYSLNVTIYLCTINVTLRSIYGIDMNLNIQLLKWCKLKISQRSW
jgi:hypothetical protein